MRPLALVSSAAPSEVRVTRRWIVLLLIAGLASCDGEPATAPGEDPPTGQVTVDSVGAIFRTVQVTLEEPAAIQVDYWSQDTPRLRVTSPVEMTEHSLFLPRLRSSREYEFAVQVMGAPDALHHGAFQTDPLPVELSSLSITTAGTPTFPLTLFEVRSPNLQFVLDAEGEVVWYRSGKVSQGFTRLADGSFVFNERTGISVETPDHRVVARLNKTAEMVETHHDVITTPDNTLLFLAQLDDEAEDGTTWRGEAIWEWDPATGALDQRWSSFDVFDPSVDFGERSHMGDWLHANSLAIGPRGNVLVSFFWLHEVTSIAAGYGSLEWRLGGPHSTFAEGGAMEAGQHTAAEVSPGRILLFDNGLDRPNDLFFSRAFEIQIDEESETAEIVWEFRPDPDIYAPIMSSARKLASGNNLVLFGLEDGIIGSTGPLALFEVTPSEEVVWSVHVEGIPGGVYRATPLTDIGGEEEVIP